VKRFLPLSVYLLFTSSAFAQNYQAFYSGQDRIFDPGFGMIGLKVDSTAFDGDSTLFFHPNIAFAYNSDCGSIDRSSWMGSRVKKAASGDHLFYTLEGEEVLIKALAELGETWLAYSSPDELLHVRSEVTGWAEEPVFDYTEMVKTINIQALDENMEPIDSYLNDLYFKLSENSGMLATPQLGDFPDGGSFSGAYMRNLIGISPDKGVQNLINLDLNDFQIGDVLEIEQGNTNFGIANISYNVRLFLDLTDYTDSISYDVQEIRYAYQGPLNAVNFTLINTFYFELTFKKNDGFDALPVTPFELSDEIYSSTSMGEGSLGLGKFIRDEEQYGQWEVSDSCYYQLIDAGCPMGGNKWYYAHLGGPYFNCMNGAALSNWSILRYGNTAAGSFGIPLSIKDRADFVQFSCYPNPAIDRINIAIGNNSVISSIRIFDSTGRPCLQKSNTGSNASIEVAELPAGIYMLELNLADGSRGIRKFVKL